MPLRPNADTASGSAYSATRNFDAACSAEHPASTGCCIRPTVRLIPSTVRLIPSSGYRDRYFSSLLDLPSTRRAMISCWICCVPSKMSRIFESRAHFSSSPTSE